MHRALHDRQPAQQCRDQCKAGGRANEGKSFFSKGDAGGAIRYRTTPLFERVFGLESIAALPRLDDLGETADAIRDRLHSVAVGKTA